jgi:hypothetical protein
MVATTRKTLLGGFCFVVLIANSDAVHGYRGLRVQDELDIDTLANSTQKNNTDITDLVCGPYVCSGEEVCCHDSYCGGDLDDCRIGGSAAILDDESVTETVGGSAVLEDPNSPASTNMFAEPPPNNECINAVGPMIISPASLDGSLETRYLGTTVGASTLPGWNTCGGASITSPSVWYTVTGNGDILAVQTCWPGTSLDTKISIFEGSCDNLVCVGANDDVTNVQGGCPDKPFASLTKWKSEVGQTYYILVSGYLDRVGNFEINVQGTNDQCEYAMQVTPNGQRVSGDTTGAVYPFGGVMDDCNGGHGTIGDAPGLWYSVMGTGTSLQARACTEYEVNPFKLHVFRSCDGYEACMGGAEPSIGGCAIYEWPSTAGTIYRYVT